MGDWQDVGAPRPPPFPHPTDCVFSKNSHLRCVPFPPPFPASSPALFSCSSAQKEECSLFPCALPIPFCLVLPWPLPPGRPQAPRSGSASSAALQPHPLQCLSLSWKAPRPNPAPAEVTGPPASSGTPWAGAGGRGAPITRTHLQQSQFMPPPEAVSMEKCQDSRQGSEPCCWWEPSQASREAGAGVQCKPRACTPS